MDLIIKRVKLRVCLGSGMAISMSMMMARWSEMVLGN